MAVEPTLNGQFASPVVRGDNYELDRAIYYWSNKLRTEPKNGELLSTLEALGDPTTGMIEEETGSVKNAIAALKAAGDRTLSGLEWNEGLNLAAKDHCDDIGPTDTFGHFGSDESTPFDRISRYGKPGWWRGENLWVTE